MKVVAKKQKYSFVPSAKKASSPMTGGLGLEAMGDLSALLAGPETVIQSGVPMALAMTLIDEDLHQPRTHDNPGFSDQSLDELAASILLRGVKTPISVRENPSVKGRYIINHGARRFRGSQRAGLVTIPGFIDNDYNQADQVVENLQRNELTAREVADFIGRELAKGMKKGDIAKAISKSPAFISQHVTLLDLPDPLATVFNSGRVRDVTVVNELMTAYKKTPEAVVAWLGDVDQEISRSSVKLLREFLQAKSQDAERDPHTGAVIAGKTDVETAPGRPSSEKKPEKTGASDKLKNAVLHVRHNDRVAHLMLDRRPPAEGFAWLKYLDDGAELEASLKTVTLVALLEA